MLFAVALLLFVRLGQEFIPTLDEKNIAMHALRIPSTSLDQSQAMQLEVEKTVSALPAGRLCVLQDRHGRDCGGSDAAERLRYLHYPQATGINGLIPTLTKEACCSSRSKRPSRDCPATVYEFTQPIQMRFNELLAGVRGDVAVKVFGDEFEPMLRAANQIAAILRGTKGATDVKVEQAAGLPFLDINVDKAEIARRGLSLAAVQDVIGTAIGGREAGVVFEGDRHFEIVVRLPEAIRNDLDALEEPAGVAAHGRRGRPRRRVPLGQVAVVHTSAKGRTRSAARTASAAWS